MNSNPSRRAGFNKAIALGGLVLLSVLAFFVSSLQSQSKLDQYKEELRAKGEKLTFAELFPPTTNQIPDLSIFITAAGKLRSSSFPGDLVNWMNYEDAGVVKALSKGENIPIVGKNVKGKPTAPPPESWEKLSDELETLKAHLLTIKEFIQLRPARLAGDYDPYGNLPKNCFVEKRVTAQWLAASALHHMHWGNTPEAVDDITALYLLAQMHSEDPTLVNQMIRVAIAGVAFRPTLEALVSITNWTEPDLIKLHTAIEGVDLLDSLERAMTGERNFGLRMFKMLHDGDLGGTKTPTADHLKVGVWRYTFAGADEMYHLRNMQQAVETLRELRKNQNWPAIRPRVEEQHRQMEETLSSWRGYKYLVSSTAIPNLTKGHNVAVRNETQRRLVLTAIALKRYELRHGKSPLELSALVPEFISAVPIDCMNGQPLNYKPNADGTFLLYSVGEDGKDDDGDPTSTEKTDQHDLWTGRDAVWPRVTTFE